MTREERALQTLIDHQATWIMGSKSIQQLRVEAMLAFADAEAAAMRERAAEVGEKYPASRIAADLATAIRALPTTEVGK